MNRRAQFDAASFILGGEISNRRKKQTQTVTDVSTPCLSTCVDYKVIQSVDLLHGQMDETADSSVCVRYSRKSSHIRRGPWALMMMQSNKG